MKFNGIFCKHALFFFFLPIGISSWLETDMSIDLKTIANIHQSKNEFKSSFYKCIEISIMNYTKSFSVKKKKKKLCQSIYIYIQKTIIVGCR